MGRSSEGGNLEAYYRGRSLRKLVATYYGETGKRIVEYYFWDRSLFFVLDVDVRYNRPIFVGGMKVPPLKVKSRAENRFYLNQGKLVRWIAADGKVKGSVSPAFLQHGREVLADARELLRFASPRN